MNIAIKYGLITAAIILLLIIPGEFIFQEQISLCIFKIITKLECPLCGMTRASYEIIHLHPMKAVFYNPISLFLPLILVIEIILDLHGTRKVIIIRQIIYYSFLISLSVLFAIRIYLHFGS
jgi:hypothetical protein